MILATKHRSLFKNKVSTLLLVVCIVSSSSSANVIASNLKTIAFGKNYSHTMLLEHKNSPYLFLFNIQNKKNLTQGESNMATIEKEDENNAPLIINLLLFIIAVLSLLTLLIWKKNIDLCVELNQHATEPNSDEISKLSQEEFKQQAIALNERQQEIVNLMAFGFSNKQIATKLFISENTVKYHIKNIYHLLHVKDRKTLWLSQN
ncbi:MAG: LuxR C-terminal-related transcriptional regulator [Bacteroidota bacterium]